MYALWDEEASAKDMVLSAEVAVSSAGDDMRARRGHLGCNKRLQHKVTSSLDSRP
jgi:hypothetical protein